MIVKAKLSWFRMLFVWNGSVLPRILPRLLLLMGISCLIVYFKGTFFHYKIPLNPAPFTLLGIALAIFLGFRNTVSYDRYWEARKLWGSLLNDARSLARQAIHFSGYNPAGGEVKSFIHYLIAFTYSLKHQLRLTDPGEDFQRLTPLLADRLNSVQYKPIMILNQMAAWVQEAKNEGKIDSIVQASFNHNFNQLSDIVGGCERIASNPMPYTYKILLHRTVYIYCFLLSFGLVDSLGWLTPFIVGFIAYTYIALEAIADEIEEPFGVEPNDLALNDMCRMIENTLLEMAGLPLHVYPLSNATKRD